MSFVRCMLKFELNDFFCLYLVELIVFVFIYIDAYPSLEGKTLIGLNALPVYHRMK